MEYLIREWLNIALRWMHVFAGIMWIGQTYFFTWLDRTLNAEGQVWMVHSGGFYIVDKQKTPKLLPKTLHWFKWEAFFTWLTGILLFTLVYYTGGLMVDSDVRALDPKVAIAISIGLLVAGWFVYDFLWISPIAKNEVAGAVISYALIVATIYGLTHVFAARAAYLQLGAMLGTLMFLNVWVRILPAQRSLIAAVSEGREPDMRLAEIAKQRSKQNTFTVMPVVFIMLSNHFPVATYGHEYNWLILAALVLVGWGAAKVIREH